MSADALVAQTQQRNNAIKSNREYEGELDDHYFDLVSLGRKTIEGRLNKFGTKWGSIAYGDIITFSRKSVPHQKIKCRIVWVHIYPTFRVLLEQEGLRRIFPGVVSIEDGVRLYEKWYPLDEQIKNGVIGLELEIVN